MQFCLIFFALVGLRAAEVNRGVDAAVTANNDFALKLYRTLAVQEGNIFVSPFNITHALGMTLAGARGDTAREMAAAMSLAMPPDQFHPAFAALLSRLNAKNRSYDLLFNAKLWGEKEYPFAPEFLSTVEKNYGSALEPVTFSINPDSARQLINQWVAAQTKDRIRDLLPGGILEPKTRLVLTSTIYFKARWMREFKTSQTKPGDFQLAGDRKIRVPMMHNGALLGYFSTPDMLGVALPYVNGELDMIILMPAKADGLSAMEKSLNGTEWRRRINSFNAHQVDLAMPRFKITQQHSLASSLKQLGISRAFDRSNADFSGMLKTGARELFLKDAIHKTFVEVNERGTEAAAATAMVMDAQRAYPPGVFHADRPFLFAIRHTGTGAILFIGRVSDPR